MPCALTEPDNYPDYLKKILKDIEAENDNEAKTCACSLTTPTTDEGCFITDQDGKLLAFPFCFTDAAVAEPYWQEGITSSIGLSYKAAMRLYWSKKIDVSFKAFSKTPAYSCDAGCIMTGSTSLSSEKLSNKDLVCGSSKGAGVSSWDDTGATSKLNNICCYGGSENYFGVEFGCFLRAGDFKYPPPENPESRGWIDKNAELIYPYMISDMNAGYAGPGNVHQRITSATFTDNKITFTAPEGSSILVNF